MKTRYRIYNKDNCGRGWALEYQRADGEWIPLFSGMTKERAVRFCNESLQAVPEVL